MSHFNVGVFHRADQDIEDLLAPYSEFLEVDPYIWKTHEEAITYVREWYDVDGKTDEECFNIIAEEHQIDKDGNVLSTYNPKSKWDYWVIGGRWSNKIKKKDGTRTDSCKVGDIDFSIDKKQYNYCLEFWEVNVNGKHTNNPDKYFTLFSSDYLRKYYDDGETYARMMSSFSTHAVVTPDGEWHEKGEMGWWGVSFDTEEESKDWFNHYAGRFVDTADPDWILTIVDCHI